MMGLSVKVFFGLGAKDVEAPGDGDRRLRGEGERLGDLRRLSKLLERDLVLGLRRSRSLLSSRRLSSRRRGLGDRPIPNLSFEEKL